MCFPISIFNILFQDRQTLTPSLHHSASFFVFLLEPRSQENPNVRQMIAIKPNYLPSFSFSSLAFKGFWKDSDPRFLKHPPEFKLLVRHYRFHNKRPSSLILDHTVLGISVRFFLLHQTVQRLRQNMSSVFGFQAVFLQVLLPLCTFIFIFFSGQSVSAVLDIYLYVC